jgi:hypothetical protein
MGRMATEGQLKTLTSKPISSLANFEDLMENAFDRADLLEGIMDLNEFIIIERLSEKMKGVKHTVQMEIGWEPLKDDKRAAHWFGSYGAWAPWSLHLIAEVLGGLDGTTLINGEACYENTMGTPSVKAQSTGCPFWLHDDYYLVDF